MLKPRKEMLRLIVKKPPNPLLRFQQYGTMEKVRLKWCKNRGLDHIIVNNTEIKAVSFLKDAILRSPTGFLTEKTFFKWVKPLGLSIPVLRFIRRYPSLFHEFSHPKYAKLPCFRLTDTARFLNSMEKKVIEENEIELVEKLCKLLMMAKSRTIPYSTLFALRWDLGLPDLFEKNLIPKYPDHFRTLESPEGILSLRLTKWRDELAVSALQRANETRDNPEEEEEELVRFKLRLPLLTYKMSFPRGYERRNKVKIWMDQFDKLPYISPYEDSSAMTPRSDLMEKRLVGVFHEILNLTLHKKTKRDYLTPLVKEYNLPLHFTRIFTRYPGIFYVAMKCGVTNVVLREGYKNGRLVVPNPLARVREKFHYVMRLGIEHRTKGDSMISEKNFLSGYKSGDDGREEEFGDEDDNVEINSAMISGDEG